MSNNDTITSKLIEFMNRLRNLSDPAIKALSLNPEGPIAHQYQLESKYVGPGLRAIYMAPEGLWRCVLRDDYYQIEGPNGETCRLSVKSPRPLTDTITFHGICAGCPVVTMHTESSHSVDAGLGGRTLFRWGKVALHVPSPFVEVVSEDTIRIVRFALNEYGHELVIVTANGAQSVVTDVSTADFPYEVETREENQFFTPKGRTTCVSLENERVAVLEKRDYRPCWTIFGRYMPVGPTFEVVSNLFKTEEGWRYYGVLNGHLYLMRTGVEDLG